MIAITNGETLQSFGAYAREAWGDQIVKCSVDSSFSPLLNHHELNLTLLEPIVVSPGFFQVVFTFESALQLRILRLDLRLRGLRPSPPEGPPKVATPIYGLSGY